MKHNELARIAVYLGQYSALLGQWACQARNGAVTLKSEALVEAANNLDSMAHTLCRLIAEDEGSTPKDAP